ncbi:MAG TPA: hypothetical protein VGM56_21550 [Byssovorax sp.]
MTLERKKTTNVLRDAKHAFGSHDDFPIGPRGTDPMPHLSRSRVAQPFFLVSAADHVLVQMAGRGVLELRGGPPARLSLAPGDVVYVPAGVPSRASPTPATAENANVHVRLKADPPAREAAAWYCRCGELVHAEEVTGDVPQEGYLRAVVAFNADASLRRCAACGVSHEPVDLDDIAWAAVASALRAE